VKAAAVLAARVPVAVAPVEPAVAAGSEVRVVARAAAGPEAEPVEGVAGPVGARAPAAAVADGAGSDASRRSQPREGCRSRDAARVPSRSE
jgi:hypothetical protein